MMHKFKPPADHYYWLAGDGEYAVDDPQDFLDDGSYSIGDVIDLEVASKCPSISLAVIAVTDDKTCPQCDGHGCSDLYGEGCSATGLAFVQVDDAGKPVAAARAV